MKKIIIISEEVRIWKVTFIIVITISFENLKVLGITMMDFFKQFSRKFLSLIFALFACINFLTSAICSIQKIFATLSLLMVLLANITVFIN